METLVTIGKASKILGVSISTLRRWDADGKLPSVKTQSGHRRYDISKINCGKFHINSNTPKKTIAYARVSSNDQREDLVRQQQVLEIFCANNGWVYELISDLGSGMNYNKKGLKRLLDEIISGKIGRLVITHKDRLLRFGAELVFAMCEAKQVEVVILNQGKDTTFEEDLATDVLEILTVFSARLYGSRSRKNKKIIDSVKKVIESEIITNGDKDTQN
jgi:predicted site-specific integrase-resolvase